MTSHGGAVEYGGLQSRRIPRESAGGTTPAGPHHLPSSADAPTTRSTSSRRGGRSRRGGAGGLAAVAGRLQVAEAALEGVRRVGRRPHGGAHRRRRPNPRGRSTRASGPAGAAVAPPFQPSLPRLSERDAGRGSIAARPSGARAHHRQRGTASPCSRRGPPLPPPSRRHAVGAPHRHASARGPPATPSAPAARAPSGARAARTAPTTRAAAGRSCPSGSRPQRLRLRQYARQLQLGRALSSSDAGRFVPRPSPRGKKAALTEVIGELGVVGEPEILAAARGGRSGRPRSRARAAPRASAGPPIGAVQSARGGATRCVRPSARRIPVGWHRCQYEMPSRGAASPIMTVPPPPACPCAAVSSLSSSSASTPARAPNPLPSTRGGRRGARARGVVRLGDVALGGNIASDSPRPAHLLEERQLGDHRQGAPVERRE